MRRVVIVLAALAVFPAAPQAAVKRKPVVGKVAKLSGSKSLRLGSKRKRKGDVLRYGDKLTMGKGLRATLRLKRPKGVSKNKDLVKLTPAKGAKHHVAVSRRGAVLTVVITPA